MAQRCLFVIRNLPRARVSVSAVIAGEEALSGSHVATLLVAEGLARRGFEIGVYIVHGQELVDKTFRSFPDLTAAAAWIGRDPTVWASYGDDAILTTIGASGLRPIIWAHLPLTASDKRALEGGSATGVITVSDGVRTPLLRTRQHRRVGRIYNPLAPSFTAPTSSDANRYANRTVVYVGAAGVTKGLHRVLEMWRFVRRADSNAKLLLAGTGKLYGQERSLGPHGIANPEFESRYVSPLVDEFGSLAAAGIEPLGLLTPLELLDLYSRTSLGVVNMNWREYFETFCCAAVEMLAAGLPVFSVSRGALPETIGRSGGAFLTRREDPGGAAADFCALLSNPRRLASMGGAGREFVRTEYDWGHVVDQWARLLERDGEIKILDGPWRGPTSARYYLERSAGRMNAGWLLDAAASAVRRIRRSG